MKWEDCTSYRQGEHRGKVTPRAWTLGKDHRAGIKIHRFVGSPNAWFLTCFDLGIEQRELRNQDLAAAKEEALEHVSVRLKHMITFYKKLGIKL